MISSVPLMESVYIVYILCQEEKQLSWLLLFLHHLEAETEEDSAKLHFNLCKRLSVPDRLVHTSIGGLALGGN